MRSVKAFLKKTRRWALGRRPHVKHDVLFAFMALAGLGFLIVGGVLLAVAFAPTPAIETFASREIQQSTKIYDRTGQVLLYDYNRDARREVVPLAHISEQAINATIAIEDSSFYKHGGIRITSIIRAMLADVLGGSLSQGGSTITQQVVKNTLLTNRKSVIRKIQEWVLAMKLEQVYTKNQILEAYLNTVPYGGTLYGIEAASEVYFRVSAKDLSTAQSAYLAAMLPAPTYYSPYGSHRDRLEERKNVVLQRMKELGFLTSEEYGAAAKEEVTFAPGTQNTIVAPHFVFYILNYLEEKYGISALTTGIKVTTTLDVELETEAEKIVSEYALENVKKFKASNASLVALDPSSGQILAMVGSRDFFDTEIDGQYNATLALRQPGSTMKPFVYAHALLNGYTRNTVIFDAPTQFSTACRPDEVTNNKSPCYAPQNYDEAFRGPMTFETALAQSINIPAIKVLYLVGVQNAINLAKAFGLTTLGDPNQYGLTLVLGGGEVRLLDMVSAYGTFGNSGVRNAPTGILEVVGGDGTVLEEFSPQSSFVLPERIANDVNAMLSDNPARVPSYSLNSPLFFPGYDVAAKTGTTNDTRDAWVMGYTPSIAVGVWVGNNDNSVMVKSTSGFIAAPMWNKVMSYALSKYPKRYFGEPSPISSSLPPLLRGNWMVPDGDGAVVPHSLLYWTNKKDPRGAPPGNPSDDSQYSYWEYGIQSWYYSRPGLFAENPPLFAPLSFGQTER